MARRGDVAPRGAKRDQAAQMPRAGAQVISPRSP